MLQPTAVPSSVPPTASPNPVEFDGVAQIQFDYGSVVVDEADMERLREYSSLQTRSLMIEELRRRAPGVVVPASDIPPHPSSPQAKALSGRPAGEGNGTERPTYSPGSIFQ
jgi:hypothetical protein